MNLKLYSTVTGGPLLESRQTLRQDGRSSDSGVFLYQGHVSLPSLVGRNDHREGKCLESGDIYAALTL